MFQKIKNNIEIVALILISGLGVMAGSLIAPVEALFIDSLTEDKFLLGLVFSMGALFLFLISIFIGKKMIFGKRKMIMFGLLLGVFYPLIYATSFTVFQYISGKLVWAFSAAMAGVMINALFHDLIAKKKNIAELAAWKDSVGSIAGTFGAIIGGYFADSFNLVFPYYLVIGVYVLSFLIFFVFINKKEEQKDKLFKENKQGFWSTIRMIRGNPYLFLRVFTEGITLSHWAMEPIIFPLIVYSITGKVFYVGLVFSLMGLVAIFALPLVGRYVDKTFPVISLKISFVLITLSFIILFFSHNIVLFLFGAMVLSLGKVFNGPAFIKIEVQNVKNELRGEYLSYVKAYDTLTAVFASLVVGLLLKVISPRQIILVFAIFTIIGAWTGFYLFNKKLVKEVN